MIAKVYPTTSKIIIKPRVQRTAFIILMRFCGHVDVGDFIMVIVWISTASAKLWSRPSSQIKIVLDFENRLRNQGSMYRSVLVGARFFIHWCQYGSVRDFEISAPCQDQWKKNPHQPTPSGASIPVPNLLSFFFFSNFLTYVCMKPNW